jgi:hypothetical protein
MYHIFDSLSRKYIILSHAGKTLMTISPTETGIKFNSPDDVIIKTDDQVGFMDLIEI